MVLGTKEAEEGLPLKFQGPLVGKSAHMPSLDFGVQETWAGIPAPSFAVRSGKCLRVLEPQFPHL